MKNRILILVITLAPFLTACMTSSRRIQPCRRRRPRRRAAKDALVTNIGGPTAIAFTPDGRLLITTQGGQLRVYQNGNLLGAPALDLSSRVCATANAGCLASP